MQPLVTVKTVHTIVWAVLAVCILAILPAALVQRFDWALVLSGIVLIECGVLAVNKGRCPLTPLAARYTSDRTDNFDIYLPRWLARHNKAIFGAIFVVAELLLLWRWLAVQ